MRQNETNTNRRLKFYGLNDYATFFEIKRVMYYLDNFNEDRIDYTLVEAIELYNVLQFIENGIFSKNSTEEKHIFYKTLIPKINKSISLFFNAINESNISSIITEIDYNYQQDLISLLVKYKIPEKVSAQILLTALEKVHISISSILENKYIVSVYDQHVCSLVMGNPQNAEQIIYKHLEVKNRREVHLPASLTPNDAHDLISRYIDSDNPNPNYLKLIADSRVNNAAGIDDKLKLKAKRKYGTMTEELFKDDGGGMTYGCEVSISEEQKEPVIIVKDGLIHKYSYSKQWLEHNSKSDQIVNNFAFFFGFTRKDIILNMPSYTSELGVFERFMSIKGENFYVTGIAFEFKKICAISNTALYEKFLQSNDNCLENVIVWFFENYLNSQFNAIGFKYKPSSKTSTYLEKSRHIFTEMESIIKQFSLYVENKEIDKDLLEITSDQVRYHYIPSLITDKYVYTTNNNDIQTIQYFLFSDQSGLGYITGTIQATNLFELLTTYKVEYNDFLDYQKPNIDKLISLGILEKDNGLVRFRSEAQIITLKNLFDAEALSYFHKPYNIQLEIDDMVNKGWLIKKTSLLTDPEASYFNYFLNQQEFSNGYDLRNKYLHGSQADKNNEDTHYTTYIITLMLMMSLVIKINDDFLLKAASNP